MDKVQSAASLLVLVLALVCVMAWAVEYEPNLAVVPLPVKASQIPFGPLPMAGILFFVAFVVYPGSDDRDRRR